MVTQKLALCASGFVGLPHLWKKIRAKHLSLLGRNLALPVRLDPRDFRTQRDSYGIALSAECPCDKVPANDGPAYFKSSF